MMQSSRRPIPKDIERDVLFRHQNVCCICQKSRIQVHHIDGNHSNNKPANCVLCIEHHAEASSTSGMVKGLSPSLLRQYKKAWESKVIIKYQISAAKRTAGLRPCSAGRPWPIGFPAPSEQPVVIDVTP
jgi:hypothetical protein